MFAHCKGEKMLRVTTPRFCDGGRVEGGVGFHEILNMRCDDF